MFRHSGKLVQGKGQLHVRALEPDRGWVIVVLCTDFTNSPTRSTVTPSSLRKWRYSQTLGAWLLQSLLKMTLRIWTHRHDTRVIICTSLLHVLCKFTSSWLKNLPKNSNVKYSSESCVFIQQTGAACGWFHCRCQYGITNGSQVVAHSLQGWHGVRLWWPLVQIN